MNCTDGTVQKNVLLNATIEKDRQSHHIHQDEMIL